MKIEHTPGPWGISSQTPTIIKAFDAFGETDIMIGNAAGYSGSPFFPSDEVAAANAKLMAAAPQLAHALTMVRDADNDAERDGLPRIPAAARATIDAALAAAEAA
jgi:hypothetical protein